MRSFLIFLLAAAACGDDDGSATADAGPTADGGGGSDGGGCQIVPSDITCDGFDGTWVFENVSHTADSISNEGDLAISDSGAMMVAFAEPLADPIFDQDIFTSSPGTDCTWSAAPLTMDTEVQNAYPSLVVAGDTFHLVWSGYPDDLNEVYYATSTAGGAEFGAARRKRCTAAKS